MHGGWDLKKIHFFGTSLEENTLWRVITRDDIQKKIIEKKYTKLGSIIDWVINPRKNIKNVSNQWETLVMYFIVIR